MICERQELVHHLTRCVRPTTLLSCAEDNIVGLVEWYPEALSVHFGRARHKRAAPVSDRGLQYRLGAEDISLNCAHRLSNNEFNADGRGEVHEHITLRHKSVE